MPTSRLERRQRATTATLQRRHKSISVSHQETIRINSSPWILPETEDYLGRSEKNVTQRSIDVTQEPSREHTVSMETSRRILTPHDEVKAFLKKNSLVAKGLTIFDVLYPTSVTIKEPQHIQVIDRYVLAKVWDDLSPLIYGSYVNKFRMVNHYAVDLAKYESRLKDLLKQYYEYISKFIWKLLPDEEKQRLGPNIHWLYLSQEEQSKNAREITQDEHTDQSTLELFAWRKLTKEAQNKILEKPVEYNDRTTTLLKNALKKAGADSALEGIARMDVEIQRAIKFLQISTDLRQHQKRAEKEAKEKRTSKPIEQRKPIVVQKIGQRVLCRYDADGYFYAGTVHKSFDEQSVILFDMEIEQPITGHTLLPEEPTNLNNLFLHDCVLVRQRERLEEYWVPGLVQCLPAPFALPPKLYRIQVFDPNARSIYAHREDMIRITLTLFQRTVLYIQKCRQITRPEPTIDPPQTETDRGPTQEELEDLLRKHIDPLSKKMDRVDQSHKHRYHQIQDTLKDHMGAIQLLQERKVTTEVRYEYAQTSRVSTPAPARLSQEKTETSETKSTSTRSLKSSHLTMITPETHVFAIWLEHDGLGYEGKVLRSLGHDQYQVARLDFPGLHCNFTRSNLFLHSNQCRLKNMDLNTFALVKYPNDWRQFWCPAVILHHNQQTSTGRIRFYDCLEENLSSDEHVIPINEQQFEHYVTRRIEFEKSLEGRKTVGFNAEKKAFLAGTIEKRTGNGHEYLIRWCDSSASEQKDEHLFGDFTYRGSIQIGDYVLAWDPNEKIYVPGIIQSISNETKKVRVQYLKIKSSGSPTFSPRENELPRTSVIIITKSYFQLIAKLLEN